MIGKHDVVIMPLTVDGRLIGHLIRPRTARQAFEERVQCYQLRKQFRAAIESSKAVWRMPIFEE